MSLYRQFKTDPDVERGGIWLDYGECRIKVARAGGSNKGYLKGMERLGRKHRRQIDLEIIGNEEMVPRVVELFADTVILDWENVTDESGAPLQFSRENVIRVMTDLPDLFRDLVEVASRATAFREYLDEEAAKN